MTTKLTDTEAIEKLRAFINDADVDDLANMLSRYVLDGPVVIGHEGGESDPFEDGERVQSRAFEIPAEAHTDDHHVELTFDAAPWFEKASDDEILALARCGWGYDYPADDVAQWMVDREKGRQNLSDLGKMFWYIERKNKLSKDTIGFECRVDAPSAMTWLSENHPDLYAEISNDEDIHTDSVVEQPEA